MAVRTASSPMVTVGFAAERRGDGVAYASIPEAGGREGSLIRVGFRCRPLPALNGRDVAFAALEAIASDLFRRGYRSIALRVDDATLAADLADHRPVPGALTIPYVRLRCTLNRFREATLVAMADRTTRDLTARARAEATLTVAA